MALQWREQLSVGNEVIDADHKQLIENLNQVEKYIENKNQRGFPKELKLATAMPSSSSIPGLHSSWQHRR
jgi:hemerythrin